MNTDDLRHALQEYEVLAPDPEELRRGLAFPDGPAQARPVLQTASPLGEGRPGAGRRTWVAAVAVAAAITGIALVSTGGLSGRATGPEAATPGSTISAAAPHAPSRQPSESMTTQSNAEVASLGSTPFTDDVRARLCGTPFVPEAFRDGKITVALDADTANAETPISGTISIQDHDLRGLANHYLWVYDDEKLIGFIYKSVELNNILIEKLPRGEKRPFIFDVDPQNAVFASCSAKTHTGLAAGTYKAHYYEYFGEDFGMSPAIQIQISNLQ